MKSPVLLSLRTAVQHFRAALPTNTPAGFKATFMLGIALLATSAEALATDLYVKAGGGCAGSPCYATVSAALAAAVNNDVIHLESDVTEGLVYITKDITLDGHGFKLSSTSGSYGIEVGATGVTIQNLTVETAGTFGIQADCDAHTLALTNVTVNNCGGTGISLNGSDNVVLTNVTSTNNDGNGVSVTNCNMLSINGITTSGNAFPGGFNAGIGLFTNSSFCLPAGINGFALGGTVNIAEAVKVYSQKANAADVITGLSGSSIEWAVGTSATDRSYWVDKTTAYAVVEALLELVPVPYPNTTVFVEEVATGNLYVDNNPNSDPTPPMLIQTAINFAAAGKTIFVEDGVYKERLTVTKSLTIDGAGTALTSLDGFSLSPGGSGIVISSGVTNVTIRDLSVSSYTGTNPNSTGGIFAAGGNNNLTLQFLDVFSNPNCSGVYIVGGGGISDILIDNVKSHNHGPSARGIVIWDGFKNNITITNCEVYSNNCCGIELQDGTASGVTMSNNYVHDNGDSGMSALGLTGPGANLISNNTVTQNGRFGIEIKLPNGSGAVSGPGSIVVQNNIVSRTSVPGGAEERDLAGIAVFRRAYGAVNANIPTGVVIQGNTVNDYNQPSGSDGFGIVIEGTNHTVSGNILNRNNVGLQQQAGHVPYVENTNTDGNQDDLPDLYFGRGNTPYSCGNTIGVNTFGTGGNANGVNSRNVGAAVNTLAGVVRNTTTNETFCSIQTAIDDSNTAAGNTITAGSGTYNEDVAVNKDLTIQGAGAGVSIVSGPIGGDGATFRVSASGVIIDGFTITRAGNNVTDWNNGNLNSAGVAIQGQTVDGEIRNCLITGNRSGIDVNNSNDNNIHNNVITNNHTGLIFRNQTDNTALVENKIEDNRTVGVLFLDASGGDNDPIQSALNGFFNNNSIKNNWYGDIVDRQAGGTLPTPGTTNLKNFECNWYGTTAPAVSTNNSAEPGYASLIPVVFGGTATPPGGQPNILGPGSANFDYQSWLVNGTDNNGGVYGFQPVPNTCIGVQVAIAIATNTPSTCFGGPNNGALTTTTSSGTAPFTYLWSNMATTPNISGLAAGSYTVTVTDFYGTTASATATVVFMPVTNQSTAIGYPSIQAAIDAAVDGQIIRVCAGTYAETIVVNKDLTILGPNTGIPGNGSRLAEAIIVPPSELNLTPPREWSTTPLVTLSADGITLDGFKISGDNPSINGYTYAGMNVEAGKGVNATSNELQFINNVVEKFTYMGFHSAGGQVSPHYKNVKVNTNKFENIHDLTQLGYGFAMYMQATAGEVTNNAVVNSRTGIQVQPYQVVQGSNGVSVCSNNTFSTWRQGVYYNYSEVGASAWTIDANTITASLPPANPTGPVLWEGIRAETMRATGNGGTISNNNVNGSGAATDGVKWWGVWGLRYAGDASVSTQVFFTGNTVTNVERGFVHDAAADIVVTGNSLSASQAAISIQRGYSSAGVQQATGGVNNIDATGGNTLNGVATNSATVAQLYAIEDAINHKVDNSLHGLVRVKTNELYVTPNSFGGYASPTTTTPSVQRAIDALTPSGTVRIQSGATYTGGADASGAGKDIVLAPGASPACVTIAGNLVLNAGDVVNVEADGTTACTQYDQLDVNGAVTLGGATLTLTLGYTPVLGDQFTIIDNDLADAVVGKFAQGASITVGGHTFQINYAGGDGNDVVLTKCSAGVVNTTTGKIFCSIQDAIDDPGTLNTHTITVAAGTYNENVVVTKALTLSGANFGVNCAAGRGAESVISGVLGNNSKTIIIQSDNVTINGFTISNPAGSYGIYNQGSSNLSVQYNIITNIGNSAAGQYASYGVAIDMGSAANMANVTVSNNCVSDIRGGTNTSLTGAAAKANNGSGVGIGAGFSTANFDITGLTISDNLINNITAASIVDFDNGGKGAYGILINVGANPANAGKAVSPLIQNNEITNLAGHWAHGIGLEGETPGAMVKNNYLNNLTDTKAAQDAIGVLLEQNDGAATVQIHDNSFNTMELAIKNLMVPVVNATCNWYGSAASGVVAAKVSGNVTYSPWTVSGTDINAARGFQPDPLACTGAPVVINSTASTPQLCATMGTITVDFMGGTAPYTVSWTGGGPVAATSPHTITGLAGGSYTVTVADANGSTATATVSVQYLPVTNLTGPTYHADIQSAVAAAANGDILVLCAGNYNETVTINKNLEIRGPNLGTAGNAVRVAEAVILNGQLNIPGANTVILDGLKFFRTDASTASAVSLGGSTVATVRNTILERASASTGIVVRGIEISPGTGVKTISNNLFTGDLTGGLFGGHTTWNNALYVNGTPGANISILNNVVKNSRTGISLDDYVAGIVLSGNTLDNNGTHLGFGGTVPTTGSFTLGANEFKAAGSAIVNLSNVTTAFRLDITSSTFNGTLFSALPLATLYNVEAGMFHRGRSGRNGLVTYVANNQYVMTLNPVIQAAVDYANPGHIINVANVSTPTVIASYPTPAGGITINKSLTIQGAGCGLTIVDGGGTALNGFVVNTGITNVTLRNLTVRNTNGGSNDAGIRAFPNCNNLLIEDVCVVNTPGRGGIYADGPVNGVTIDDCEVSGAGVNGRGIVIWNGFKQNILLSDNNIHDISGCCGIELQDGNASAVTMTGNQVTNVGDSGMGAIGLNGNTGPNVISGNTITNTDRFGIEVKNPNGFTTVSGNTISRSAAPDLRDGAGIAVIRRDVSPGNVNVPTGVTVTGNTITGYVQPSNAEGFGIVIEGTDHTVTLNNVNGCDIGIQQQAGNLPYPGNGDQEYPAEPNPYFGRGNSPITCGNTINNNTLSNTVNTREVGPAGGGSVLNVQTDSTFCSINTAIADSRTLTGHTLTVGAGTFAENVAVSKSLTINGAGNGSNPATNTVVSAPVACAGVGFTVSANNVTINNLYVTGHQQAVQLAGVSNPTLNNLKLVDYCLYGINLAGSNQTVSITSTTIQRTTPLAGTVGVRAGTANAVNGMTIDGSTITGNDFGINVAQATTPVAFDDIMIKNSTISNNVRKGMYFEKLSNAVLENLTMDSNGTDPTYDNNAGIDINLKFGSYSNITIRNNDITNSGALGTAGNPEQAAAVMVKARDDGGTYGPNPATLTNVTIKNNRITGPRNGIRFGEFGTVNNGPSNVTVEGNDLSFAFGNKALIRRTNNNVNLVCNWHGSTDLATILAGFSNAGTGSTILTSILNAGGDGSANAGFQPTGLCTCPSGNLVTNTTTMETFCTIQAAIDDPQTLNGHVLSASAGTYIENITVNKQVEIRGAQAGADVNTRYGNFLAGKADPTVETIITPAVNNPATASTNDLVRLASPGVILNGLVLDGNNPAFGSSPQTVNGTAVHARMGVTNLSGAAFDGTESGQYAAGGLNVHHTIIQNFFRGMELSGPYLSPSRSTITNNLLRNFAPTVNDNGYAITLFYNFYADVTNNTIDLTGSTGTTVFGVRQQNCDNTVSGGPVNFSNNSFTLGQNTSAFFINNNYGNANPLVVATNTINSAMGVVPDANERPRAITMWSSQGNAQVSFQNNVLGSSGGQLGRGYYLWHNPSNLVSITGGSVANAAIGISMHTNIGFGAASATTIPVSGTSISANSIGVRLNSNGGVAAGNQLLQLTNVPISVASGGTGVQISDLNADGFTMGVEFLPGNSITGGATGLQASGVGARLPGNTLSNTAFSTQTGQHILLDNTALDNLQIDATAAKFDGTTGAMKSLDDNFITEDKITHAIDDNTLGFILVNAGNDYVTTGSFVTPATTTPDIQRGIDAASSAYTVNVAAGAYNNNLSVNKALTLSGANFGVDCAAGRGAESIISGPGASGTKTVSVDADGVTINGFTISNPAGSYGIYNQGRSNLSAQYNIITNIGHATTGSGASYGVAIDMGSAANMANVTVSNNCVSDIRGGTNTSLTGAAAKANNGSGVGIGAGFSTANFDITGLTISDNLINNITAASIVDFNNGGKGAYGILINVGANPANAGKAVSPLIQNNEITNLTGHWAHGIGLEGETPGAQVRNNYIDNLTDTKPEQDAIGVLLEQNAGAATVEIHDNSFETMELAIKNLMAPTVNATCNWYDVTAAAAVAARISGNVNYTPWMLNDMEISSARGFHPDPLACSGEPVVLISAVPDHLLCGEATGSIAVTYSGGSPNYTVSWTGTSSGSSPALLNDDNPVGSSRVDLQACKLEYSIVSPK